MAKNILITPASARIDFSGLSAGTEYIEVEDDGTVKLVGSGGTIFRVLDGGQVQFHAGGGATAPDVSFIGDPNTGMYRQGADAIGFATGGAERVRIDSSALTLQSGMSLVLTDLPSGDSAVTTKGYVDRRSNFKVVRVRVENGTDVDLSDPGDTFDDVTLVAGDRLLLTSQSENSDNGIYVFDTAATPLVRADDFDTIDKVNAVGWIYVREGTTAAQSIWYLTSLIEAWGVDAIGFQDYTFGDTVTAGDGIAVDAGEVSLDFTGLTTIGSPNGNDDLLAVYSSAASGTRSISPQSFIDNYGIPTSDFIYTNIPAKRPVRAVITSNITVAAGIPSNVVDGVSLDPGNRILLTGQSSQPENGIYTFFVVDTELFRPDDGNSTGDIRAGTTVYVQEGTLHAKSFWVQTNEDTIAIGSTDIQFEKMAQYRGTAGTYTTLVVDNWGQVTSGTHQNFAQYDATNTWTASQNDTNAAGWQLTTGATSSTAPTLIPNRGSTTTGIGSQASGNLSLIASGTETIRVTSTYLSAVVGNDYGLRIDRASGNARGLGYFSGGSLRWVVGVNSTAEGGSDAGSDFAIYRYTDAGSFTAAALTITRSTGHIVGPNAAGWELFNGAASGTVPTLLPTKATTTTGIGSAGTDIVSLISGGTEILRTSTAACTVVAENDVSLRINRTTVQTRFLGIYTNGSLRWGQGANATAEAGADAGSDWAINRYSDAGAYLSTPFFIPRATGHILNDTASSWSLRNIAASSTVPTLVPHKSSTTTGIGAQASGNISLIASGAESVRVTTTDIRSVLANTSIRIDTAAGNDRYFGIMTANSTRWTFGANSTAEAGSDAGTDFAINRYSDAGSYTATPVSINRATGQIQSSTAGSYAIITGSAASSTVPTLIPNRASTTTGIGSQASGNLSLIAGGTEILRVASSMTGFASLADTNAAGYQLTTGASSSTAPTLLPNKAGTTTGIGAQASGNLCLIASATECVRVTSTDVSIRGSVTMTLAVDPTSALHAVTKQYVDNRKESVWIPAVAMTARTTNGAAAGTAETATNKVMIKTLDYDTTTQEFAQFQIQMPKSWNESTVTFVAVWSHASTSTNFGVAWSLAGLALSDDDAQDTAFGTAIVVTDTGGTTNDLYRTSESSAVTISNTPAENDVVTFQIARVPADGGDTMAIDARLHGVLLFYTTNAVTDA